ncbi:MAG: 50S ribosomal protein L29 [Candidatus Terrybacteria bacterium RIFCSPHIGHO2_01_FULL_48_17]|uniref:Large ribosomal subunit protein uL29 n=1 Tax=Candidatus Terrybacteria bacterium RIFCSPHIGHO2_01_FULL_48_17 TaxID=1802362 RepID=A0A1G2PMG4_9BACT|nr:MAG: 50S ribosomal protein L29 [Candidatus Terrybacteria bacterium RIFCSPHIGHO2_01_FULL_48_17]OHA52837.1 MAG: 50S ribosomal protein L29 [Candidatus Terrybacteria bacterium RIFCSPLOWO2_01_FULL_48_14]
MNATDLNHTLQETRDKLRQLRFNLAGGRIRNIREIRAMRRRIARILTLLHLHE